MVRYNAWARSVWLRSSLLALAGAAQFRCRHHLHRFGDLLRIADRADPLAYRFKGRHDSLSFVFYLLESTLEREVAWSS